MNMEREEVTTFDRLLHKMDEDAIKVIDADEKKLKHESQKIAQIKQKIEDEERRYMKMLREFAEEEVIEAKLEEKALKKAEDIKNQLMEALGSEHTAEVTVGFYTATDNAKDATNDFRTRRRVSATEQDIEGRRNELFEKRKEIKSRNDEALRMEKEKIEHLHEQLEKEERAYAEIRADLAVELMYKAKIHRECELEKMAETLKSQCA